MPEPESDDPVTQDPPEAEAPAEPEPAAAEPPEPVAAPRASEEPQTAAEPAPAPSTSIADDLEHHLDPRYVEFEKLVGLIITAAIAVGGSAQGLVLGSASLFGRVPWWATILGLLVVTGLTVAAWRFFPWWAEVNHRHHAYRVGPRGIEIRHGVWWRAVVNVPRSRVQHTDVSQGPLERRFGLATLHIHTAGTEQAEVLLPGLDRETALAIRDHLVAGGQDDAV